MGKTKAFLTNLFGSIKYFIDTAILFILGFFGITLIGTTYLSGSTIAVYHKQLDEFNQKFVDVLINIFQKIVTNYGTPSSQP